MKKSYMNYRNNMLATGVGFIESDREDEMTTGQICSTYGIYCTFLSAAPNIVLEYGLTVRREWLVIRGRGGSKGMFDCELNCDRIVFGHQYSHSFLVCSCTGLYRPVQA
jgi:hypothetical protein